MSIEQIARQSMEAFMKTKLMLCKRQQGPDDCVPQLDIGTPAGRVIALIPDRDEIVRTVGFVEIAHGRVTDVVFMADAFGQMFSAAEEAYAIQHGDLGSAFDEGDLAVHELLMVTAIECKTGEVFAVRAPYRYDDHGLPLFDAVEVAGGNELEGAVLDELRKLVRP